ncbi:MAG: hypothetical protein R3F61_08790 [Myxococcota bacterium]
MSRTFPALTVLFALAACTTSPTPADGTPTEVPATPVVPPPTPVPQPMGCSGELVMGPNTALGAIGLAEDGEIFVVGSPNHGNPWQLARFDRDAVELEPVVSFDASWVTESYIDVTADRVRIHEFYPTGGFIDWNRGTGEVTRDVGSPDDTFGPYAWAGSTFSVVVGSQVGECENLCFVRESADGSTEILVDDGVAPFSIGGVLAYTGRWAYFGTYASTTSDEDFNTLRRLDLETGVVELVHAFAGSGAIQHFTVGSDGTAHWVREEGGAAYFDAHDIGTGETRWAVAESGPSGWVVDVVRAGDRVFWGDDEGVSSFGVADGGVTRHHARVADSNLLHFAVDAANVWFTETTYDPDTGAFASSMGCYAL